MKLIISLDGGGVRGIISLRILDRLQEMLGVDLTLHTHLWAGTSVGGISALAIAGDHRIDHLIDLTERALPKIFKDNILDDLFDLGKIRGAEYSYRGLEGFCRELLGDRILGDLNAHVVVPAIRLHDPEVRPSRWRLKVYHNLPGEGDEEVSAAWLATATASAPTYFPLYHGHVDGGLVANNPSMVAIGTLIDARNDQQVALKEVALLSIGTGVMPQFIKSGGKTRNWGAWQWKDRIIPLILETSVERDAFLARQLLGKGSGINTLDTLIDHRFCRVQPILTEPWPLDSIKHLKEMIGVANRINLDDVARWLEGIITDDQGQFTTAPTPSEVNDLLGGC